VLDGEVNPGDSAAGGRLSRQSGKTLSTPRGVVGCEARSVVSSSAIAADLRKAPSQMWRPCFLGHHVDVSQNTSDYPPRVQPGRIRGRPCFEHGYVEEWGLDAITTKGAQDQSWPCGGTAGSVHGEFH